ncbi:MAG: DNA double-strand break repair nuclease NurA [Dehalococcoidia bacterium]|nr:MAG: DNA double-strand break repair nuclease NurA [Dehalococcoidia bacterium]
MPLDLAQVLAQIKGLAARLKEGEKEREEHLELALKMLSSAEIEPLNRKIVASKTTWLVAGLVHGLDQHYDAPPCPKEFTVLASDGSHIDVDRHSSLRCYLINIGSALLHYGENPDAFLYSEPALFFGDDLVIGDGSGREELIEGALLGVKRSVEECLMLSRLAQDLPSARPTLALIDGSLILWGLQAFPEFVREALLDNGFLKALDSLKALGGNLALASYISFSRSTDVVNALRVALCPNDPADCDRYCSGERPAGGRECDAVAGIQDRGLFERLLGYGQRSPLFISGSRFVQKHYREHDIHFFYLKLDEEVARVEIPRWVAEREELIDLVHALVLDQCRRGHGYPVALMEAHEKAVVTTADRERFWELVELSLAEDRLNIRTSGKRMSKRLRWV